MRTFMVLCGVWAILLLGADLSAAASFDCSKAASREEKLVCGNPQVSAADEELAGAYRVALESLPDREKLKKEQQAWIRNERNACRDAQAMLNAYKSRIAALRGNIVKSAGETLREADRSFTFRGEPINPVMLNDLLPWLSDALPGPAAVDIAGGGNRYSAEIKAPGKGVVRATWKDGEGEQSFEYRHLGVLANGMHVLRTEASAGGSGVFTNLLLVRFLVDAEYTDGGTLRSRVIMLRTGSFTLGDRYDGSIKVEPNRISIGPGGRGLREKAKTEVITFK